MDLDELLSFLRGYIVPTVRVGGNLRGSGRYSVSQPRSSKEMGFKHLPSLNSGEYISKTKQGTRRFKRVGLHSTSVSGKRRGPRTVGIRTESGIGVKIHKVDDS